MGMGQRQRRAWVHTASIAYLRRQRPGGIGSSDAMRATPRLRGVRQLPGGNTT